LVRDRHAVLAAQPEVADRLERATGARADVHTVAHAPLELHEFEQAGFTEEEIARAHSYAREAELSKEGKLSALADKARATISDWRDISELEALAVPSKSALDAANVQYGTEVKQPLRKKLLDQGKTPLEADEMMKSPSDVRRLIESDPELKTKVDVIDAVI